MAARTSAESLQNSVSCSICLEIFQDPVSIHCGHTFCRACINQSWEGLTTNFSCPQCREKTSQQTIRPNWELASIIEVAKRLSLQQVRNMEGEENLCKEHQEALRLFCKNDEKLICLVCDKSKVHRNHSVVPVDEAARDYKKLIQNQLYVMRLDHKALQSSMEDGQNRVQDYNKRREAAKQKIVMGYKNLHTSLKKKESFFLAQLEQLDTEITNAHEEILNRLLEKITSLGTLIGETERIYLQPPYELLKDIKTTLKVWEREPLSQSLDISPELQKKFCDFTEKTTAIKDAMEKFQDLLDFEIPFTTQMTLDLKAANARFYHLRGCNFMEWLHHVQDPHSKPEKLNVAQFLVNSRGFTSGWHCWDVEIYREGVWVMGVAKESVLGERRVPLKPEAGVWALYHNRDGYKALTSPNVISLTLPQVPQRIRICLDFHERRVMFFDAVSKAQIFTFLRAAFEGERVYPWFLVMADAHLKIFSQDRGEKNP